MLYFLPYFQNIFSRYILHDVQSKFLHRKGIQKYYKYKFFFENVASKQCKFYFWFLLFFRSYSILIWVMYNKCHKNDLKKEEWIEHIYGSLLVSRFRMFGIFVSIHFFSKTGFRLILSTRTQLIWSAKVFASFNISHANFKRPKVFLLLTLALLINLLTLCICFLIKITMLL